MKSSIAFSLFVFSLSSFAASLNQLTLGRIGANQWEARVANSDEGFEITLTKCNNRPVSGISNMLTDLENVYSAHALFYGNAVMASDMSPGVLEQKPENWLYMSYKINQNVEGRNKAIKVIRPIILLDGKSSNILEVFEKQARALCYN